MKKIFLISLALACAGVLQAAEKPKRVQQEIPNAVVHGFWTYDITALAGPTQLAYQRILRRDEKQREEALNSFFESIRENTPDAVRQTKEQKQQQEMEEVVACLCEIERQEEADRQKIEQEEAKKRRKAEEDFESAIRECVQKGKMEYDKAWNFVLDAQQYDAARDAEDAAKRLQVSAQDIQPQRPVAIQPAAAARIETQADRCARGVHGACNCLERFQPEEQEPFHCGICWEGENGLPLKSTICAHVFHEECLNTALKMNRICPQCKIAQDVSVPNALSVEQDECDQDEELARAMALSLSAGDVLPEVIQAQRDLLAADEALARALQAEINGETAQQVPVEPEEFERLRPEAQEIEQDKNEEKRSKNEQRRRIVGILLARPTDARFVNENTVLEKLQMHKALLASEGKMPETIKEKIRAILNSKHGIAVAQVIQSFGNNRNSIRTAVQALSLKTTEEIKNALIEFLTEMI